MSCVCDEFVEPRTFNKIGSTRSLLGVGMKMSVKSFLKHRFLIFVFSLFNAVQRKFLFLHFSDF